MAGANFWRTSFGRQEAIPWNETTERALNHHFMSAINSTERPLEQLDLRTLPSEAGVSRLPRGLPPRASLRFLLARLVCILLDDSEDPSVLELPGSDEDHSWMVQQKYMYRICSSRAYTHRLVKQ